LGALSEPRHEQNLYANPKTDSEIKSNRLIRPARRKKVQRFFKNLLRAPAVWFSAN